MPLKVALAVPVRRGASIGFYRHLTALITHCSAHRSDIEFVIFYPAKTLDVRELGEGPHIVVETDDYKTGFTGMVAAINASACNVVLNAVTRPLRGLKKPIATVVQNIEPIQRAIYSMSLLWRIRLLLLRREHAKGCAAADMVIAVSHELKRCLIWRFGLPEEKIAVVYHGVSRGPDAVPKKPSIELCDHPFVFCAGSIVPYRGYEDVIRALGVIRLNGHVVPQLVIAGSADRLSCGYHRRLLSLATDLGVADRIVWAGMLSSEEMDWCYINCIVFVQTSRAEACPNIVLEALYHGCLNVSCNQEPMPEIFRDGAIYYTTGDGTALAGILSRALFGDLLGTELRAQFSTRARQRSLHFQWQQTANTTADLLLDLARKGS